MSAKLRHAAKTEHQKYEFNQAGGLFKKDNLEQLAHMKGLSDTEFLYELFLRKDF